MIQTLASRRATRDPPTRISVSDLLIPFNNFQVVLHVPFLSTDPTRNDEGIQQAIEAALIHLHQNNQPAQLPLPHNHVTAPAHFAAGRHIDNQAV